MRRRTKVVLLAMTVSVAIIPATIDFGGLAAWPSESLIESLSQAKTADESIALVGRQPDLVIPPNPGAKNGISQWVWTKDRTKENPDITQRGWLRLFVTNNNLILDSEQVPSPSFFAFLKDTGQDVLEKAGYPPSCPVPPPAPPGSSVIATLIMNAGTEPEIMSQKKPISLSRPCKLGDIKVVGNELTMERIILRVVGLSPAQTLCEKDLAIAEAGLIDSGLFMIDEKNGIRPTVQVIDPEGSGEFKDILVTVTERFQRR